MSIPVPLDELAVELARRSNRAYLVTIGEDGRAHCVASTLEWSGEDLVVPAGGTSIRNATARSQVVLLSPPADGLAAPATSDEEGYSLIIDAEVTGAAPGPAAPDGGAIPGTVRARPVHAVLHRPAVEVHADAGRATACAPAGARRLPAG
ncbi:MAG: pyridoxamine 5'-phosphate oxidase family protein [Acidimicrobiales bacterium]